MMKRLDFSVFSSLIAICIGFLCGSGAAQTLEVELRDLPPGGRVILQFEVRVNDSLPPDAAEIALQGTVAGSNFSPVLTDDPDTPEPGDPTRTNLFQPPVPLCQSVNIAGQLGGSAAVPPESVNDGSFDPDGGSLSFTLDPPGPFPVGATPVLLIVTDDELDSASCEAVVMVMDALGPLFPPELISLLEEIRGGARVPRDVLMRMLAWYFEMQ